jgi:hypothetical protein
MNIKLISVFVLVPYSCYSLPLHQGFVDNFYEYSYSSVNAKNIIHMTNIKSQWCGNISLSTLVGHHSADGSCVYASETPPHAVDHCGEYYLNGASLEGIVGQGYSCAATHAHSYSDNAEHDGYDYYNLLTDSESHYIGTEPTYGEIDLQ